MIFTNFIVGPIWYSQILLWDQYDIHIFSNCGTNMIFTFYHLWTNIRFTFFIVGPIWYSQFYRGTNTIKFYWGTNMIFTFSLCDHHDINKFCICRYFVVNNGTSTFNSLTFTCYEYGIICYSFSLSESDPFVKTKQKKWKPTGSVLVKPIISKIQYKPSNEMIEV